MRTRRDFLRGASLLAMAPTIPSFLAATARGAAPEQDGRVLVVVQLDGGNDGLNTVVPLRDEGYAKHRKALRLDTAKLLKLGDSAGLHPSLAGMAKLYEQGELAIVQGVGYPNPSRSHFRSMAVWHSARIDPEDHGGPGWLGRVLDERLATGDTSGSYVVGDGPPPAAVVGRRSVPAMLERLDDLALKGEPRVQAAAGDAPAGDGDDDLSAFVRRATLDAYTAADRLAGMTGAANRGDGDGDGGLEGRLSLIAGLLKSGARARIYYTRHNGYDTHAGQLPTHARLLFELSDALKAFQADLAASGLADRVVVVAFSEFGRRVAENDSGGTDHGTAGPVFLAGSRVKGGLVGGLPSLLDLDAGDVKTAVDFRRIYAAVLEDWLGLPSPRALGGRFDPLPLFRPA